MMIADEITIERVDMYRLAAFDMDGTLLMPDHRIGQATQESLHQLAERGLTITFATGRHYLEMQRIQALLGLRGYLLTGNGTRVHNADGELLHRVDLDEDIAQLLMQTDWQTPTSMHVFRDEGWFTADGHPALLRAHQFSGFRYQHCDIRTLAYTGNAKICFCGELQDLLALEVRLRQRIGKRADICFSAVDTLEVLPCNCNKGAALQVLCQSLQLEMAHCMAFGDAMNDQEMLAGVGLGLVMGNAMPQLKQALPHLTVIGRCDQQGVSHYLQHWLCSPHLTYSPEF